jgi:hypothetical protein
MVGRQRGPQEDTEQRATDDEPADEERQCKFIHEAGPVHGRRIMPPCSDPNNGRRGRDPHRRTLSARTS